jgi:hypothetical protein
MSKYEKLSDLKDDSYYYLQAPRIDMMCGYCIKTTIILQATIEPDNVDGLSLGVIGEEITEHPAKCSGCDKHTDDYDMTQDIRLQEIVFEVSCFVRDAAKVEKLGEHIFSALEESILQDIKDSDRLDEGEDIWAHWKIKDEEK